MHPGLIVPLLLLRMLAALDGGVAQQNESPASKESHAKNKRAPAVENKAGEGRDASLNLLGKVDADSGESQRNENVQFNLIDNNALKEASLRLGSSATIIGEFRADRGYATAEFGNLPAMPLHVPAVKLDRFHGDVRETHRNSVFRARSFFQAGPVQPAHENHYGFDVETLLWPGGALALNGDQQKVRGSVNGNVLIPKLDERTPLTTDPAAAVIITRFMAAFPDVAPNRTDINPRALNTNAPETINTDAASGRLDQQLGKRDHLSALYQYTGQHVDAYQFVAGENPNTTTLADTAHLTWTRSWTPQSTMLWSAGFERVHSLLVPEPNAVGPTVDFSNALEKLGPGTDIPLDRIQNRFRYAGELRQTRNRHDWYAGFETGRKEINGDEVSGHRFIIYFRNDFGHDGITNFRLGLPSRFAGSIGSTHRGFRDWENRLYAGDHWRVSARLTLNYGLRYEPAGAVTEVNHLTDIPFSCDCNNLAPRFGLAYRLPRRWGVVRAAYGLHYVDIFPVTLQQTRYNPPNSIKIEIQAPPLVNPLSALKPEDLSPDGRSIYVAIDPNLKSPYSHQYNFSWEAELSSHWKLQLGYVGSRTHGLPLLLYTNRAPAVPGIPQTTDTISLRRPDPRYYDYRKLENLSIGYFDAARVSLAVPNWRGVSFDAAYWFSKATDLGSTYMNTATGDDAKNGQSQNEFGVQQDLKGLSSFDQPHAFLSRLTYRFPWPLHSPRWMRVALARWSVTSAFLAKTGTPFTVVSGSDAPGFGNVDGAPGDRPNLVDPSVLGRTIGNPDTASTLLPRSAFAFINPNDPRGNLGINTFRKGGIRNLNAAVSKDWSVAGEKTVVLRAEAINLLNTPQFADPGKELASPNFGQITNTLNEGRTVQFTLRFRW